MREAETHHLQKYVNYFHRITRGPIIDASVVVGGVTYPLVRCRLDELAGFRRENLLHGNPIFIAENGRLAELYPAGDEPVVVRVVSEGDDGCCHKTRVRGAQCPIGRDCPYAGWEPREFDLT